MSIEQTLIARSGGQCELSAVTENLAVYEVPPVEPSSDHAILVNEALLAQINSTESLDPNAWRGLNDSVWSQVPAVQVMAWRILTRLSRQGEGWATDLLDMLYLEDDVKAWAESGLEDSDEDDSVIHKDSNGSRLAAGDNVVLIKDLDVKGTSFVGKRGTAVRGISLTDNPEHIEGRVNGVRIVILTKFVKKM
ncbi:PhnA domain-containing protein [Echinimonas agarilytica]|uniref:PhnA domain-containing protein n=1 Tax=Echinimonas agarilytica TaxID=1215918 RepID=A0AA41W7B1_9GAMM|nr:alkylphosphonate utilization protein [Echinimonas agarilytica]MCM2680269.1 PhnA domain-containing protein [Echinimonas agarilytica]